MLSLPFHFRVEREKMPAASDFRPRLLAWLALLLLAVLATGQSLAAEGAQAGPAWFTAICRPSAIAIPGHADRPGEKDLSLPWIEKNDLQENQQRKAEDNDPLFCLDSVEPPISRLVLGIDRAISLADQNIARLCQPIRAGPGRTPGQPRY